MHCITDPTPRLCRLLMPVPTAVTLTVDDMPIASSFANVSSHPPTINELTSDLEARPGNIGIIKGTPPHYHLKRFYGGAEPGCRWLMAAISHCAEAIGSEMCACMFVMHHYCGRCHLRLPSALGLLAIAWQTCVPALRCLSSPSSWVSGYNQVLR